MTITNFDQQVYQLLAQVPAGLVTTYGQIAKQLGNRHLSRRVGQALHRNPDPSHIPCHRVVNQRGSLARGFAFGSAARQKQLLIKEGVTFCGVHVDLKKHLLKN